ncbi:hypothetical protein ACFWPQ_45970 [Streptomyces sp. NPDC058464]|uniref:hypothetical protein n=1 Tax=Streptomyces sp. NPDC058464 TaxID=3346511 RepID=UPI003666466F
MAQALGVSPSTVGGWEQGRDPSGEVREKYAYFLAGAQERLRTRTDPSPPPRPCPPRPPRRPPHLRRRRPPHPAGGDSFVSALQSAGSGSRNGIRTPAERHCGKV